MGIDQTLLSDISNLLTHGHLEGEKGEYREVVLYGGAAKKIGDIALEELKESCNIHRTNQYSAIDRTRETIVFSEKSMITFYEEKKYIPKEIGDLKDILKGKSSGSIVSILPDQLLVLYMNLDSDIKNTAISFKGTPDDFKPYRIPQQWRDLLKEKPNVRLLLTTPSNDLSELVIPDKTYPIEVSNKLLKELSQS